MDKVREYVEGLSDAERVAMMNDFDQFEEKGEIGDCSLRRHAATLTGVLGVPHPSIPQWMGFLVNEVHRLYAEQWVEQVLQGGMPSDEWERVSNVATEE